MQRKIEIDVNIHCALRLETLLCTLSQITSSRLSFLGFIYTGSRPFEVNLSESRRERAPNL